MKLIVGLGNPGKEYENTRHNTGFMIIDAYAMKRNISFDKTKFGGTYGETIIQNEKVILLKPQKYINLSGEVIQKYVAYYKIAIEDVLIICDDMDLEVGTYKLRYKGSSTHNGLKNIEANLHTQEYKRLKVGISKNKQIDTVAYVLGKFTKEEQVKMNKVIIDAQNIIDDFITLSFDNLMNKYN